MARFPRTAPKVAALARNVIAGLETYATVFPSPPVSPDDLRAALDAYSKASHAAATAAGIAKQRFAEKDAALKELTGLLKTDIRYAENTVDYDHGSLKGLGWGGRKPKTPVEHPSQVLGLEIVREGEGWIALRWNKPADGGKPAAYRVQLRASRKGSWREVGSTVDTEITLHNQERGVDLEYRIVAINRAGESTPSGTAAAVL